ncbi:MAG: ABC transporter permease [Eubacteriales bacterium]
MIWSIARRNLRLYFRDRASVFFSLLAVFIIIGLYVLFLGNVIMSDLKGVSGGRFLMDSWVMAGLLGVASITTTMGAFGIMVEDRAKNIMKDFSASPVRRSSLVGGYVTGSFLIGMIMSLITLVAAEVYIDAYGGEWLGFYVLLQVLGIMVLSVLASTSIVFFMVSFFKSLNAFATASTILGTIIGFLTGIYVPIGSLPQGVQDVIKCFPVSHAGALFRQVMMQAPIDKVFAGAPAAQLDSFKISMGVVYQFGDQVTGPWFSVIVLVATAIVFYLLAMLNVSRKRK